MRKLHDHAHYRRVETSSVHLYVDYRDLSAGNYPSVAFCDECAEGLSIAVEFQGFLEEWSGVACDQCGRVG